MAVTAKPRRRYPKLVFGETLTVAIETFRVSKVRFILTSLGMVIGTASLILVVTIGLTGKQYLLQQIQNIGSNMMVAEYSGGGIYGADNTSDFLTLDDLNAVRERVPGISNASPMIEFHDHIVVPGGKERDILVLGVSWQYLYVRNLEVLAGRFFDDSDTRPVTRSPSSPRSWRTRSTVPKVRRLDARSNSAGCLHRDRDFPRAG